MSRTSSAEGAFEVVTVAVAVDVSGSEDAPADGAGVVDRDREDDLTTNVVKSVVRMASAVGPAKGADEGVRDEGILLSLLSSTGNAI